MSIRTSGKSERIQFPKFFVSSILRMHSAMADKRDQAVQNANPTVVSAYDALLKKGDEVKALDALRPPASKKVFPFDRTVDRILSGMMLFSAALKKIFDPEGAVPLLPEEQTIYDQITAFENAVLPDGAWFLQLPWKDQWAENERTLTRIQDVKKQVGPFDLGLIADRFQRSQTAFSKALGIQGPKDFEPLFVALDEWQEALEWLDTMVHASHRGDLNIRKQVFFAYYEEVDYLADEREKALKESKKAQETPEPTK